ncbi:MAG: D-galactarate dehydratase/Altronate hydrolase domain protein [Gemmatimonadetes bacterium]|nr:D-galactarate dehydratase/Altronate hydrolase domain protein [Gemmatimonadota bacterium]
MTAAPTRLARTVRVHSSDDVAVAVDALEPGDVIGAGSETVTVREAVPAGHKVALRALRDGDVVHKYGWAIGRTTADVEAGAWIHSHNLRTLLEGTLEYAYEPIVRPSSIAAPERTWEGYKRADGRVGTRNEVWVINTVGCVNWAAEKIARSANERFAGVIDGVHAFAHPYGCSQLGDDLGHTRQVLAGLMRHPNAGGVLVLGLGCENNQLDALLSEAGDVDRSRIRFFNTQDVFDELQSGVTAVDELVERMKDDRRETVPASALVIGNKCGGSDGFSGITANPLLGRVADRLTAAGGSVLLTEVPEMFGAERMLMNRAASEEVYGEVVGMVNSFKDYFLRHGQPVYENPSPGNKAGGLTTLEEKSLGAVQKGGSSTVTSVLRYGQPVRTPGLALLESPGNDGVSSTAMVASGATVLLFTTGRGTPLGFPVPTVKVSSNSVIAQKKPHWIDFDAGALLDDPSLMDRKADELLSFVLDIASGTRVTNNERNGIREIAIWKEGVTL